VSSDLATPPRAGGGTRSRGLVLALRVLGAVLLGLEAWIHGDLWQQGYRDTPVIGPAFLLNTVLAAGGALLVLLCPRRFLAVAAVLGALLSLGTLGGLAVSTTVGLFGFVESTSAPLWWQSVVVEVAAVVVLGALAALTGRELLRRRR
jgi:hypothetical protein